MNICPCCGQTVQADGILIDDASGIIALNGRFVRLPAHAFALFQSLQKAGVRGKSKEQLMDDLYWRRNDDEEPDAKIIDVWVCKLRPLIAPLGIRIETLWGKGYRMQVTAGVAQARASA